MRYRPLGQSGLAVSAIGVGTWAISGAKWGPTDDRESIRGLQLAVDLGSTLFDTVDAFGDGHGEELLGMALRGRRHAVHIIAKGGVDFTKRPHEQNFTAGYLERALGQSLRRLQTDFVDVYMLHSPPAGILRDSQVWDFLESMRQRGKVLTYGASLADPADAMAAIEFGRAACLMLPYNVLDQAMGQEVLPAAERAGVGIIARAPLALGVLSGTWTPDTIFHPGDFRSEWNRDEHLRRLDRVDRVRWLVHDDIRTLAQAALAFAVSHPAVIATTPGFRTAEQVAENMPAGDLFPLPQEDIDELSSMYEDDFGFAPPPPSGNPWEAL